jgi:hypothetical protein
VGSSRKDGNQLLLKAYDYAIGVDLDGLPEDALTLDPLTDPQAATWEEGQTHATTDVQIHGPAQRLTLMIKKNRARSPRPQGGNVPVLGFQIVQLGN